MWSMATTKKRPPAPPKLASEEEVAKSIDLAKVGHRKDDQEEQDESTIIDRIREHLAEVDSLLDDLEEEQS
jgi:hypothetical protein